MTMIAFNRSHNIPFLVSDLLWSSKVKQKSFVLPTNPFDITPLLPEDREYHPFTLGQKMYIIKDNLCILFAGDEGEIIEFLRELTMRCKYYDVVEQSHLFQFLNEYPFTVKFTNSALFLTHVALQPDDSANFSLFYVPKEMHQVDQILFNTKDGKWNMLPNKIFQEVYAIGSGMRGYLNIINQETNFDSQHPQGDIIHAIQINASLIAKLLSLERVSIYTALQHWGGGFELALFTGERFEKIQNIAYLISEAQFKETGDIDTPIPKLILYYRYIDEQLYITMIEINEFTTQIIDDNLIVTSNVDQYVAAIHVVPRFEEDDKPPHQIQKNQSFNTNRVAMGYSLITKRDTIYNPASFNQGPEIQIKYVQDQSIEIAIDIELIDRIKEVAKNAYPNLMN